MKNALRFGMTLAVIALLFLAFNLVWALKLPSLRLDLSKNQVHSLSPPTKALLTALDTPVELYFFNSSSTAQHAEDLTKKVERVTTLLKEYENAAEGKIKLNLIEPAPFSEDAYKARLLGLDGKQGFFGLVGSSAQREPQRIQWSGSDQLAFLEYDISRLIHHAVRTEPPVIGLITGLPIDSRRDEQTQQLIPAWQLLQDIRRQFNLMSLGQDIAQIPPQVKTLMVVQPLQLPENTLLAIDQFVLRGGKLLMFIDPMSEGTAITTAPSTPSKLQPLLAAWGVQMPLDKVLADKAYATPARLDSEASAVPHPGAVTLPKEALAAHDVSTRNLQTVRLLSPGALKPHKKSRTTFTPLLQSSAQSALFGVERFVQPDTFDALSAYAAAQGQPHVLAARIQGPASSAFTESGDRQSSAAQKTAQIHVVLVADTDLLSDHLWTSARNGSGQTKPRADNATFVLNLLDHLSAPDTLSAIRPHASLQGHATRLGKLRTDAARAYREKAGPLEQRLEQTEKQWQSLTASAPTFGTQAATSNPLLQALNQERLRLPMELQTAKDHAYRKVRQFERWVQLLSILTVPLLLGVFGLCVWLLRRRRQHPPAAAFY